MPKSATDAIRGKSAGVNINRNYAKAWKRWCGLWRAETRMIFAASGLTGQAYVPVLYSIMKLLRRTSRERSRT